MSSITTTSKYIIEKLELVPHPEGGFYKETYRADAIVNNNSVSRNICTAILFLLENEDKSHFHRIKSDEIWFFHKGESIEIIMIINGKIKTILLGNNIEDGEMPQAIIPANTWFAASLKKGIGYGLVSCTVSPGFDFNDFEIAKKPNLTNKFPNLNNIIERFCL